MCGRLVQRYSWHAVQDLYELRDGPIRNLQPLLQHCADRPGGGRKAPANGAVEMMPMRSEFAPWGALKELPAGFNGRAETAADKAQVP